MRSRRFLAAAFAAAEALVVVAVGLAIPLIPLTILWATNFDAGIQWDVYYRAAADIWLLGHGVHITVTLDPSLAASLNLPGIDAPFLLSLAPTAFAIITFLLAMRLGRRTIEAEVRLVGPLSAIVAFGVVAIDERGRIERFVEKPAPGTAPSNLINAGTYVLEPSVLARIPAGQKVSIERITFPEIVAEGAIFGMATDDYWIDTGKPDLYLAANLDLLDGRRPHDRTGVCSVRARDRHHCRPEHRHHTREHPAHAPRF
jgi:hypothetical protein